MKKQPESTEQTRQNMIDAFWSIYCTKRIEKITVKEITDKAGYNRGTFYVYFKDVYDVLEQIEQSLIPALEELPPVALPEMHIGMPLDVFLKLYEQNSKYYAVLLGEKGDPAFAAKLKNAVKPMLLKEFSGNREIGNIELDYMLEFILSAMIGIISYWFSQGNLPADKLVALMYDLMEKGVMAKLK